MTLPSTFRQFLHEFNEDEQTALIAWGARTLGACGAPPIRAFRAGSYGANSATLRALMRNNIFMDSSYNAAFTGTTCKLVVDRMQLLFQPWPFNRVFEFPVTVFEDYPGHLRNAQVGACSLSELTCALDAAWRMGWRQFTIALHSFECVRERMGKGWNRSTGSFEHSPAQGLCEFLAAERGRFRTMVYSDVDPQQMGNPKEVDPIKTGLLRTAMRVAEQAWARLA